jgi:hypothetical protein
MPENCYVLAGGVKKELVFCRNIIPAKRNSWKVTLGKKGTWKGIPFFCRNLEIIPQDSWNWKAKKGMEKQIHNPVSSCLDCSDLTLHKNY